MRLIWGKSDPAFWRALVQQGSLILQGMYYLLPVNIAAAGATAQTLGKARGDDCCCRCIVCPTPQFARSQVQQRVPHSILYPAAHILAYSAAVCSSSSGMPPRSRGVMLRWHSSNAPPTQTLNSSSNESMACCSSSIWVASSSSMTSTTSKCSSSSCACCCSSPPAFGASVSSTNTLNSWQPCSPMQHHSRYLNSYTPQLQHSHSSSGCSIRCLCSSLI